MSQKLTSAEIIAIEDKHTCGTYAKSPLVFVRGEGACLYDADGVEYIDCNAGHGVANLGHANPKVAEAVARQAKTLLTLFETYPNDQRAMLMEKITALVPGLDRVYFCNSGTESVEAALKFARLSTGRVNFIATMRGFHGRTMGALSATWNKAYREPFNPLVPGFSHVPYNKVEALEKAVTEETAAVILEAVQGEGGVFPADPDYLKEAQRICKEKGALLILDEVQSGFCRTGKMFACQHYGVTPDLLCCAKSLAGGVPIGAVLIGPAVQNLVPGTHGSTFGGNPLSCAAAIAALDVMEEEKLAEQAAQKGAYLVEKLKTIQSPLIHEVRGLGLMVGIELKQKVTPYLKALQEKHVIALNAGLTVIRLLPPLVVSYEQLDSVVEAIREVLASEISGE
jgi:LysW-gamma-L-lysine/LysW-L-ornithine aminotransferase